MTRHRLRAPPKELIGKSLNSFCVEMIKKNCVTEKRIDIMRKNDAAWKNPSVKPNWMRLSATVYRRNLVALQFGKRIMIWVHAQSVPSGRIPKGRGGKGGGSGSIRNPHKLL